MKQEELKIKMDDIVNDFDKESLWIKIDNKKKKRRPFFYWTAISLVFVMISFLLFNIIQMKVNTATDRTNKTTPIILNEQASSRQYSSQDKIKKSDLTNADKSNIEGVENRETPILLEKSESTQNQTLHAGHIKAPKNTKSGSKHTVDHQIFLIQNEGRNVLIDDKDVHQISNENLPKFNSHSININDVDMSSQSAVNSEKTVVNQSYNDNIEVEKSTEISSDLNVLQSLYVIKPLLVRSLKDNPFSLALSHYIVDNKPNAKNNIIKIFLGIGSDNHQFSDTDLGQYRQSLELSLESKSLAIMYEKKIGRFSIETGLTAAQSQTILRYTERFTTWKYIKKEGDIETWTGNQYKLYNEYQRLDLNLSVSYGFTLGKFWSLSPTLGLGYNIVSRQKGNMLEIAGSLSNLADRKEYRSTNGLFMCYGLKFQKSFRNDVVFDVQLLLQSKRSLIEKNSNDYGQNIQPITLLFGVGKKF